MRKFQELKKNNKLILKNAFLFKKSIFPINLKNLYPTNLKNFCTFAPQVGVLLRLPFSEPSVRIDLKYK